MPELSVGSLFSGIGGFDLGFERAGMTTAFQIEIDKHCQGVLQRHWPGVPRYDDVSKSQGAALPTASVLCGGFPCQDLSVAGRRAGLAGERSGLFYEFARLIDEIAPTWVVIENVPGILSSAGGRDMGAVIGTLVELGYGWAYRVLDAQYFGVAQRRRRVFIVGHADTRRAAEVLFEPESCNGNPPPSREAGQRAAGPIAPGAHASGFNGQDAYNDRLVAATLRSRQHADGVNPPGRGGEDDQNLVFTEVTAEGWKPSVGTWLAAHEAKEPHTLVTSFTGDQSHPLTARAGRTGFSEDGTGRGVPMVTALTQNQREEVRLMDQSGALNGAPDVKRGSGTVMAGSTVRRLTPVECERLQGFPDGWTDGHVDSQRYRMLGNAVAVPVAEWIGRRIVEVENARR